MILFNKRKANTIAFVSDTKDKLFKFMDECQNLTNYYSNIDKEKEFYAMLIDDVVRIFKKEYKRILCIIDNNTDIQWKLTEYEDLNAAEYTCAADSLKDVFSFIELMTITYDEFIM